MLLKFHRTGARHGGDLRGIINKLDYLQNLGITTIWMNPVLENRMPGGSSHGYATTDYYNIDPRLGTNEEYCELVDKAHAKGMKIVMDFNTCFDSDMAFTDETSSREGSEAGLFKLYEIIAQDYLFEDPTNMLVFLDNHDVKRFNRQDEPNLNRFKQAMAFLLTTRGIPQLYYGTEILMYGGRSREDGGNRKDFPGGWSGDETNAFTAQGRTPMQNEAWDYLNKLLKWRKTSTPVTDGKLIHYTPDRTGCYVYARIIKDSKTVLVLLNGTDQEQTLNMHRFREVVGKYHVWHINFVP